MRRAGEKQTLLGLRQSSYPLSRLPSFPLSGTNTTNLAHCDAVWGGRQPPHLNGVELLDYLADVLTRIVNGHPNSRIDDILPWAYTTAPELKAVA